MPTLCALGARAPDGADVGRNDRIELRNLRLLARCGTLPHEQAQNQPIEVDIDLSCDLQPAEDSDNLGDTVDYSEVCAAVDRTVTGAQVALLEHLAARIADAVLRCDQRIEDVSVAVRKLRPAVPQDLGTAGVRIERRRS